MSASHPSRTGTGGGAWRRPRVLGVLLFGVLVTALLVALSLWQVQRLVWKQELIALLAERLAAPVTTLPEVFAPETDEFRRVAVTGRFTGEPGAHGFTDAAFLTSARPWGPGYRVIQPFGTTEGRIVLVDRGFVPIAEKNVAAAAARPTPAPEGELALTATLRWPEDGGGSAASDNVWLTREVDALAPLWGAEPVLLVAETATAVGDWPVPQPTAVDLPNNHLSYAITWGALALVCAGMSGLVLRRELTRG